MTKTSHFTKRYVLFHSVITSQTVFLGQLFSERNIDIYCAQ